MIAEWTEIMAEVNRKLIWDAFGVDYTATTADDVLHPSITFEDVERVVRKLRETTTIYYMVSEYVPVVNEDGDGVYFVIDTTPLDLILPEDLVGESSFLALHPDLLPEVEKALKDTMYTLKPLSRIPEDIRGKS